MSTQQSEVAVFAAETTPEWTEGEISFALTEDNQDVTLGLQFDLLGREEQQLYLDNIKLYRTSDVTMEDLINEVLAGVDNARNELSNKQMLIDPMIIPDNWVDPLDDYAFGMGMDTISSVSGANNYLQTVQAWSARLDSLEEYRAELQHWNDSVTGIVEAALYDGLEAVQLVKDNLGSLISSNPDLETIKLALAEADDAVSTYTREGLLAVATYDVPSNVSFLIVNPGIDGNVGKENPLGWSVTTNSGQPWVYSGDRFYEDGTTNSGTYFNTWDGTAGNVQYTAVQEITGAPLGIYSLRALVASDGNVGCYLYAKVGDSYYYTMAPYTSTTMDTVVVMNIPVVQEGQTLTIGITCQAEDLWSGAEPFDGYIISGDDFELLYHGYDPAVLKEILETAIAEVEALLADDQYIATALKGDVTVTRNALANAQEVVKGDDAVAFGTALAEMNAQTGLIATSVEAAAEVQMYVDSANTLIAESAEKMGGALETLETELEFASAWIVSEDAITADAAGVVENLTNALTAVNDSIIAWERAHLEVGDATMLLVNPNCEDGTTGYHMESYNNAYIVAAADFFPDNHPHLCFWSGSLPADSVGFDMYQIVGNIPSGYYRMTAMAVVGAAGPTYPDSTFSNGNVVFYAVGDKDHEVQVPLHHAAYENGDTLTYSNTTGQYDSLLLYSNEPYQYVLDSILVNHGEFKFGMKTIGPMNVTTARIYGFTLEYLAPVEYEPYPDAIEEVGADATTLKAYAKNGYIVVETDEPYEIYSVSGGAAMNPDTQFVPGVYIVKAGSQTVKVLVD